MPKNKHCNRCYLLDFSVDILLLHRLPALRYTSLSLLLSLFPLTSQNILLFKILCPTYHKNLGTYIILLLRGISIGKQLPSPQNFQHNLRIMIIIYLAQIILISIKSGILISATIFSAFFLQPRPICTIAIFRSVISFVLSSFNAASNKVSASCN